MILLYHLFGSLIFTWHRFPPDKEPWPPYTVCESLFFFSLSQGTHLKPLSGDFFPPAFFCPHELERVGDLGDGGKWFCGLSRLQEKEDCIVYSIGTSVFPSTAFGDALTTLPQDTPQVLLLRLSFSRGHVIANFFSSTPLRRAFRPRFHPLRHCQVRSANFTPLRWTRRIVTTSLTTGTLGIQHSVLTSSRIASPILMPTRWAIHQRRTPLNHSCARTVCLA
jgi:Methyltransferase domain